LYQSLANTSHESALSFSPAAVLGPPVVSKSSSSLKNRRDRRRNFRPRLLRKVVGNDFVAVAAAEAVRKSVCVAIRAEGLVRVDEEFSFPKYGSAAIAEKALFVISMVLKPNATVCQ